MLYVIPSSVSVSPSLVHVTVVAGESVEVQVKVRVSGSYVRLDTAGRAEEMNIECYMSKSMQVDNGGCSWREEELHAYYYSCPL